MPSPIPHIVAILLHVPDWASATDWYAQAFPQAERIRHQPDDWGHLQIGTVELAIVNADAKVACGPAGSVVYWSTDDIQAEIERLCGQGATLYRGPMNIGPQSWMCQVQDPWGNCIGLRQN
ncbi:MAG: VOC family protein [Neisseriaceae bacterium]|nr:VOC family protein [Neisseriaceae bacterium]